MKTSTRPPDGWLVKALHDLADEFKEKAAEAHAEMLAAHKVAPNSFGTGAWDGSREAWEEAEQRIRTLLWGA